MMKFREIPKERELKEVEAVIWAGDNLDEVKEFLGECFVQEEEEKKVFYLPYPEAQIEWWVFPWDVIYKDIDGEFKDAELNDFLNEWAKVD